MESFTETKAASFSITVVVDNYIDIFLADEDHFRYPRPGKQSSLLAEQGLSLWIEATGVHGGVCSVLYDFGRGGEVTRHNLALLDIDIQEADYLLLSHGHIDHFGGLLTMPSDRNLPAFVAHPLAFGERGLRRSDGTVAGPWVLSKDEVRTKVREVITAPEPRHLGAGLWTSGRIPRCSDLDPVLTSGVRKKGDKWEKDEFEDELSLFAVVEGKGLIVITGCCHAGLINTIEAGINMFPGVPIYSVIGGFHLNIAGKEELSRVVDKLKDYKIGSLVPLHCTGAAAKQYLREEFRERCPYTTVGMVMDFS